MRNSRYVLINAPMLDMTYNHTPCFTSQSAQINWFMTKSVKAVDNVQYLRKESAIQVPFHVSTLSLVNYAITQNSDNGKYYFYFVYDRIYQNENNTLLIVKLDVIQTYLFDINFGGMESLIDRAHVDRFGTDNLPIINNLIVPEDLEIGEYTEYSRNTIYDYREKGGYIITSSDKLTAKNGGSTGGGTGAGIKNKMISPDCFVFLKGYEALGKNAYDDGVGNMTIGYGVTEKYQKSYYDELYPTCTEEQASQVLHELIFNQFSKAVYDRMSSQGCDMSKVKQCEFDAFVSFAYNSGVGGMSSSQIFIDYCNNVSRETIAEKWLTTNIMAGTSAEQGLRARRKAESDIFLNGVYAFKPIGIVGGGTVTENNGKGFIPSDLLTPTETELGEAVVISARKLIGKPYVWGGNVSPLGNSEGTDCSGLMQWAYNDNNISISRTTYTQINEGIEIYQSAVQKGDLIFSNFSSPNVPEHVYMYSGNIDGVHMCIEAQQTGTLIKERAFTFNDSMRVRRLLK